MKRKITCPETNNQCEGFSCKKYKTCLTIKKFDLDIKKQRELIIGDAELIIDKTSNDSNIMSTFPLIKELLTEYHTLHTQVKTLTAEAEEKRDVILSVIENLGIHKISGTEYNTLIYSTQRFKEWSDENAVVRALPIEYRNLSTLSPNYKKIKELVKQKTLPKEILDFVIKTEPNTVISFRMNKK